MTIQLDTNEVRGFLFSAQTHLHWPSISRSSKIKFPLTQIGNTSVSTNHMGVCLGRYRSGFFPIMLLVAVKTSKLVVQKSVHWI